MLRRGVILGLVLATGAVAPAAAQAPQPTLQFDRTCYTEDQEMRFTGAGYTPNGQVDLIFARPNDARGQYTTQADATGAINDFTIVGDASQLLNSNEEREDIFVSANDRTRVDTGAQPPESQFAGAQFTFTRWAGYSPGRYVPGRKVAVEVYGWAFAAGQTAWLQFRKRGRFVASVKLGRLSAECGDRAGRVRVPLGLKKGRYRIVLSTSRKGLSELCTYRSGRVTARPSSSAAAAAPAAMARAR